MRTCAATGYSNCCRYQYIAAMRRERLSFAFCSMMLIHWITHIQLVSRRHERCRQTQQSVFLLSYSCFTMTAVPNKNRQRTTTEILFAATATVAKDNRKPETERDLRQKFYCAAAAVAGARHTLRICCARLTSIEILILLWKHCTPQDSRNNRIYRCSLYLTLQRIRGGLRCKPGRRVVRSNKCQVNLSARGRVWCPPVSRRAWLGVSCPESHRIDTEDSEAPQNDQ